MEGEGARGDRATAHQYLAGLRDLLGALDTAQIERAVTVLRTARDRGSAVYVIGNGGSAAAASHFATDLAKATRRSGRSQLRVISLTDNSAFITALSNDEGYEHVFTGQLDGVLREADVLVAISASGRSANVLAAVKLAKERRATSLALVGFDGGDLLQAADHAVHVRSAVGAYGPVEDALLAIHHLIAECLARE